MFLRPRDAALLNFMAPLLMASAWLAPDGARGDDPHPSGELAVKVMTFNIRYGTANDGPDARNDSTSRPHPA
jgi:hypothetical protein